MPWLAFGEREPNLQSPWNALRVMEHALRSCRLIQPLRLWLATWRSPAQLSSPCFSSFLGYYSPGQFVHKIGILNRIRQIIGSIGKAQVARRSISLNWQEVLKRGLPQRQI